MTVAFDFHTLSLSIDETLDEYRQAIAGGERILGLHVWETTRGKRSQVLKFRHEHAHFTSYMASGMADLYGVFSDYLLVFLFLVLRAEAGEQFERSLRVPLLAEDARVARKARRVVEAAWHQVNSLRSMFFGFGTNASLAELTTLDAQDAFWSIYFDERFSPIVKRFYGLVRSLAAAAPETNHQRNGTVPALPPVAIAGQPRQLTTRSVMETYALSIELMNTFFRSVITSLTIPETTTRNPGPLYTTALAYALERAGFPEPATVDEYLYGTAPQSTYYEIAAIAFAAMQVPCLQLLDGSVLIDGTVETLCPAHRFVAIVDALGAGRVRHLPNGVRSSAGDEPMLKWLFNCHKAIGDRVTSNMLGFVAARFAADPELGRKTPESQSLIDMSWAARANLVSSASDYVLDGGLFSEKYWCQVRYVRTRDAKLAFLGDDIEIFQAGYIAEHAVPILEAAVFPRQWDSAWAKLPEIPPEDRGQAVVNSIVPTAAQFGYVGPDVAISVPNVIVAM